MLKDQCCTFVRCKELDTRYKITHQIKMRYTDNMTPLQRAQDPQTLTSQLWELLGVASDSFRSEEAIYRVKLLSVGQKKIAIIKEIGEVLSELGSRPGAQAGIALVDSIPSFIEHNFYFSQAVDCIGRIMDWGGVAMISSPNWNHDPILCQQLAQHPRASGALLQYLLMANDTITQEHIAKNPNISKQTCLLVALLHPQIFVENPLFPLLLLEDPSLSQLGGNYDLVKDRALMSLLRFDTHTSMLLPAALASYNVCQFLLKERASALSLETITQLKKAIKVMEHR
jgi:hypothetical protein